MKYYIIYHPIFWKCRPFLWFNHPLHQQHGGHHWIRMQELLICPQETLLHDVFSSLVDTWGLNGQYNSWHFRNSKNIIVGRVWKWWMGSPFVAIFMWGNWFQIPSTLHWGWMDLSLFFDPPEPQHSNNTVFHDFSTYSHTKRSSFCWLFLFWLFLFFDFSHHCCCICP